MIHSTAIISKKANLGNNVQVGAYTIIRDNVTVGDNTEIGEHVIIEGPTKIGRNNKIFPFAYLGAPPQFKKYAGEPTTLEIGDNNIFREYASIHRGSTVPGYGKTKIGHRNYFMAYVHIAHDCTIGNDVTFANNASLAGHVEIGNFVTLGGFAKILQFSLVGDYSFIAGSSDIVKDILPYMLVSGLHGKVKVYSLNTIGLERNGFGPEKIKAIKKAYDIIYRQRLVTQEAILALNELLPTCPEVQPMLAILQKSKHGILR